MKSLYECKGISLNRVIKACLSQSTITSAAITKRQSGISTHSRSKYELLLLIHDDFNVMYLLSRDTLAWFAFQRLEVG